MLHSHALVARGRRHARRTLALSTLVLMTLLPVALVSGADGAAAASDHSSTAARASRESAQPGAEQRRPRRTDDFVAATFNVLGHSHTAGPHRRHRFAGSAVRMTRALEVLRRTGIDLVGFQELQRPQYKRFLSKTDGRWGVFSGTPADTENSIAWRRSQFRLVRGWAVPIPYFHGNRRQMPVVELESRLSGQRFFVMNVHNPADTRGPAAKWRRIAVARERSVTTRLTRRQHAPVLLTGDMNDRGRFFCPMTRNHVMHAASGGSHRNGRCHPHASGVDWILGNKHVSFRSYRVDRSRLVATTTDHPVVSAHVRIASR
jgi:endonuclease/exonuclease/phosphatase family metal-dependent hydrolase